MFYKAFADAEAFPTHHTLTAKMTMPLPWPKARDTPTHHNQTAQYGHAGALLALW